MSDQGSPFSAAANAGVTMTEGGGAAPQAQPNQQGGGGNQPRHQPPADWRPPPAQRARASDFSPHAQRDTAGNVEQLGGIELDGGAGTAEADDGADFDIVNRTVAGRAGKELAATKTPQPRNVAEEAQLAAEMAEQDAAAHQGEEIEAEATIVDENDPDLQRDPRFKDWLKDREKYDAIMGGDQLHSELHSKFFPIELPNGRRTQVTIQELGRGYLRQSDYTNKLRELYDREASIAQREQGWRNAVGALSSGNPQAFLNMITTIHAFDTFHKAALIHGHQLALEDAMTPEQRQLLQHNRKLEAHIARMQNEQNYLRSIAEQAQQQQVQGQSPDEQYISHQLYQLLPKAEEKLAKTGRPYVHSSLANDILARDWEVFVREHIDKDLTTDGIVELLQGVMEQVEAYDRAGYVKAEPPAATRQLPPVARQAPAPSGAAMARQAGAPNYQNQNGQNGRATRLRASDIANIHRMPQR